MIYQNDKRLNQKIQSYGCYLLSILRHVEIELNLVFSVDEINNLYDTFLKVGLINSNCMILNGSKIFGYFNIKVIQLTGTLNEKPSRINPLLSFDAQNYFQFGEFYKDGTDYNHFVGVNEIDSVFYDSYGLDRERGKMIGKRVYKRV